MSTIYYIEIEEAKRQFPQLLARAAAGESVVIVRDGEPLARLESAKPPAPRANLEAVVAEIRASAAGRRLDGLRIKDLISEGRR